MTQRVLQVYYYPIRHVLTGGQIRVASIASLIELMGYEYEFMGIYPHRNDGWESDFPIDSLRDGWAMNVPHNFESRIAEAVIANAGRHREIIDGVKKSLME